MCSCSADIVAVGDGQDDPVLARFRVCVARTHSGPGRPIAEVPFILDDMAGIGTGVAGVEGARLIDGPPSGRSDDSLWCRLLC
jgi:hypothetical protein